MLDEPVINKPRIPTVEVDVELVRENRLSIIVRDARDNELVLPTSQILEWEKKRVGDNVTLTIPEWLAVEKGLV